MKILRLLICMCAFMSSIAHAELVFIVNNSNTATFDQTAVSNIFLGKTKEFPGGGKAIPVIVDFANPDLDGFLTAKVGKNVSQFRALWARLVFAASGSPPQTVAASQEMVDLISKNPNLIGIADAAVAKGKVKILVFQ